MLFWSFGGDHPAGAAQTQKKPLLKVVYSHHIEPYGMDDATIATHEIDDP